MNTERKIKINKGSYALRAYDKDNNEIYYTSTHIGLIYDKDCIKYYVPINTYSIELKSLDNNHIVKK